jgi:hypothetical protein
MDLIYYKLATKATRNQRFLRDTLHEIRIGLAFGWDFGIDEKRAKAELFFVNFISDLV